MSNKLEFGKEIRALRRKNKLGLTLSDAAAHIDCSIALMSAIETGQRSPPSNEKIRKLLAFYGCADDEERLLALAAASRKSIDFSLVNAGPKTMNVLLGLARRSEEGGINDDDPVIARIAEILDMEGRK